MRRIALIAMLVSLAGPAPTRAFTVGSGFSDACHERISAAAFLMSQASLPPVPEGLVPDGEWERILDASFPEAATLSRDERFLLFSLVVGARAPDSEGFSLTNLTVLRSVHADPRGQYVHCLRAPEDDHSLGNATALAGCRREILENVRRALEFIRDDTEDELIEVPVTLDNYGSFEVEVDPPTYYFGRALHTFEDSFTHTLRTPDMRRVVHVMNYEAAIAGDLDEGRDGMAHSGAADSCVIVSGVTGEVVNRARVFAATEASAELGRAFGRAIIDLREGQTDVSVLIAEIDGVLLKWLRLADPSALGDFSECTEANDYCDSPWLEVARLKPTAPILGCSAAPAPTTFAALAFVLVLGLARVRPGRGA